MVDGQSPPSWRSRALSRDLRRSFEVHAEVAEHAARADAGLPISSVNRDHEHPEQSKDQSCSRTGALDIFVLATAPALLRPIPREPGRRS